MKKKELINLKKENKKVLEEKVLSLKKSLIKESMPSLGNEARNLKSIRSLKRDIAQILTIMREKKDNSNS